MKSLRSFHAMPVILSATGKRIGRVKSVRVNRELTEIRGVCAAGHFGRNVFFKRESISLMGKVAVIVTGEGVKKPEGVKFALRRALDVSGAPIGAVTDLYADDEGFSILCAELTYGVFEDLARGRKLVRRFHPKEDTGEIVIHEEGEEEDEEGSDPRYDCGNDCGRVCRNNLRHDELGTGKKNGTRGYENRESDFR